MFFNLLVSYVFSGFFMKASDDIYDLKNNKKLSILFGVICALFASYASIINTDACYIFLSILIGNLIALKVDGIHHIFTLILYLIICLLFGFPSISLFIIVLCVLSAFFDELGHELIPKYSKNYCLILFFEYRCVMKVFILFLSIIGIFDFWTFVFFILFDISYEFAGILFNK